MRSTSSFDLFDNPPDEEELQIVPDISREEISSPQSEQWIALLRDDLDELVEFLRITDASPKARAAEFCHAVFGLTGRLIDHARQTAVELLGPPASLVPVRARGVEDSHPARMGFVSGIAVPWGDARILIRWHQGVGGPEIRLGLYEADQAPMRPFDVSVRDDAGTVVAETLHVSSTAVDPEFPQPSAGAYVFHLSSPSLGRHDVRIEVKDEP